MATVAQTDHLRSTVQSYLTSLSLPDGVALRSVDFKNNSWGDPSIFVNYAVSTRDNEEQRDGFLLNVLDATLASVDQLNLPFFVYVDFLPA